MKVLVSSAHTKKIRLPRSRSTMNGTIIYLREETSSLSFSSTGLELSQHMAITFKSAKIMHPSCPITKNQKFSSIGFTIFWSHLKSAKQMVCFWPNQSHGLSPKIFYFSSCKCFSLSAWACTDPFSLIRSLITLKKVVKKNKLRVDYNFSLAYFYWRLGSSLPKAMFISILVFWVLTCQIH